MTVRNNEDRVGARAGDDLDPSEIMGPSAGPLSFVTPTEFVELPSKGEYYPKNHPLHQEETVEIRYMTAKDEDILTSRTLLKKGIVLDRLVQNVLVNKAIKSEDLLIGDKNAIIVATRATGYGSEYKTKVNCPSCSEYVEYEFDLDDAVIKEPDLSGDAQKTENGTFMVHLPKLKVDVEVKLLTGRDEVRLNKLTASKKKHKMEESLLTDQFRQFIVGVNGSDDQELISSLIDNMPAYDSRYLRYQYQAIVPNIDLTQDFECPNCGLEQEMEVPFTADFFWTRG
mgnify:CR=1 FL=1|tara:strand:- start:4092 stop:4943 length:852 start_codon:yes stop_codon:yes gene_type:complete